VPTLSKCSGQQEESLLSAAKRAGCIDVNNGKGFVDNRILTAA